MQTKEMEPATKTRQKVQLVKGTFTPSEAADVIGALIDQKINFHKIQRLQRWEGNHSCETGDLNDRISELEGERERAREFISQLRKQGRSVQINGILELTVAETGISI